MLISINDAAEALGVGRATVCRLIAEGHLDAAQVRRRRLITEQSFTRFIQEQTALNRHK